MEQQRLSRMHRRAFLLTSYSAAGTLAIPSVRGSDSTDPWSKSEVLEPAELERAMKTASTKLHIYCVAFPMLYRQRHIRGATLAGPASKPEGIGDLRTSVAGLPKDSAIVIYCGCCPMKDCPNIRPAYRTLKQLGFDNVRVLDLPTNLHTDWVAKGYSVD